MPGSVRRPVLLTPFAERPEHPYNVLLFDPRIGVFTNIQMRGVDTTRIHDRVLEIFGVGVQMLQCEQVKGSRSQLSPSEGGDQVPAIPAAIVEEGEEFAIC